ncbi:hypothetical protein [Halpernia frigidisoli]|uniref:Uncharacterized protein n=1 Tax=Halpernia frigidisoli TaxID=1125876 RepID=A0A1I3D5K0_9FLAO|nr:hypothetical protein [Halpernia frigidisoli]SFH81829.1 hypothetical protein SAMN05443292_0265 [Halpernia frigidisoli]
MKKKYTKQEFENLDFDNKCAIFETVLTDDYFSGQEKINFYFDGDINIKVLSPTPKEEQEREDREFKVLLDKLTIKLFRSNEWIELDIDEILK